MEDGSQLAWMVDVCRVVGVAMQWLSIELACGMLMLPVSRSEQRQMRGYTIGQSEEEHDAGGAEI